MNLAKYMEAFNLSKGRRRKEETGREGKGRGKSRNRREGRSWRKEKEWGENRRKR
jgi:hypothetical protein